MKTIDRKKLGAKSRRQGKEFENKVRKELENINGFVLFKNGNNVDLKNNKLIPCKPIFNPFTKRVMMMSGGFPDFITWSTVTSGRPHAIECKMNNLLTKEEKAKCKWLIDNKVFNIIYIAFKTNKKGSIGYEVFK